MEFVSNVYMVGDHKVIQCNIRDITERKRAEAALSASELGYRRLFESAQGGIMILDAETGVVFDVNPYLLDLLGFTREDICGKQLWELGFFSDIVASKASFLELQQKDYVRYEDLPLETASGERQRRGVRQQRLYGGQPQSHPVQHPRHHRAQARRSGLERYGAWLPPAV